MSGANMQSLQKAGLLNSWKEIANYLGRGVRTVQRWEEMGLPVQRLGKGPRAPVIANTLEIDHWMQRARKSGFDSPAEKSETCFSDALNAIRDSQTLRQEMRDLRADQRAAVRSLTDSVNNLEQFCRTQMTTAGLEVHVVNRANADEAHAAHAGISVS